MQLKKILVLIVIFGFFSTSLFATIYQVKVSYKVFRSANNLFGAIRVNLQNESAVDKNGIITVSSNNTIYTYPFTLSPNEFKKMDIPVVGDSSSVVVTIGSEHDNTYVSKESVKTFENGVLEITVPGKGALYFHNGANDLDKDCVLERINLEELPNNLYCLFSYQIIVLPTEVDSFITPEQFLLLKSYAGFGGKIIILGKNSELNARWKKLNQDAWGSVISVKKEDSIDFASYLSKGNILDPRSTFFNSDPTHFNIVQSSKAIYLIIVLLFIVCIGPLNYYMLKKRNKSFLIFLTSPLIAVTFSALLIIVFFLKEGFYQTYDGISLTLINPQTNQALVNIKSNVYSSNITGEIVRPRNGLYFPVDEPYSYRSRNNQYMVKMENNAYLSGGFSKARSLNKFGEIRLVECNSNVLIRYDGQSIYAKNRFGSKQKLFVIDARNQKLYESRLSVEPDQEVLLNEISYGELGSHKVFGIFKNSYNSFLDKVLDNNLVYIATADTNEMIPFREKDGYKQGDNTHIIVGVIKK